MERFVRRRGFPQGQQALLFHLIIGASTPAAFSRAGIPGGNNKAIVGSRSRMWGLQGADKEQRMGACVPPACRTSSVACWALDQQIKPTFRTQPRQIILIHKYGQGHWGTNVGVISAVWLKWSSTQV